MTVFLRVPFDKKKVQARIDHAYENTDDLQNKIWIVLGHGAFGGMNEPQLAALTNFLKPDYIIFRYTCKGGNVSYRLGALSDVLKFIWNTYNPKGIFIGGRSFGARVSVTLTESDVTADIYEKILGIICLSYPLHKEKDTNELRDAPLKQCQKPLFFLSGTKDDMCKKEILDGVLLDLKTPYKMHWLEGYDHSAKSSKKYQEDAYATAFQALADWCKNIGSNS